MKINQIRPQEAKFTEVLETIALKPKMLYYIGKLPENVVKTVGIVGARRCTSYGEKIAYEAAFECAKAGAIVVSGLAYGIDSIAARGALDAGGRTIAILGTPIDRIYPEEHLGLAREIVEQGGAILSEYGPRSPGVLLKMGLTEAEIPLGPDEVRRKGSRTTNCRTSFLYRNRLIAALSEVILVVEANERSGSLNTASHALEQNKELFAVPGDITRRTSVGCNRLIAQGAHPYLGPQDMLEVLFPERRARGRKKLPIFSGSPTEKAIVSEIAGGRVDGEEIIERLGLSVPDFTQAITMLEIRDIIRPLGMNKWMIK
ncbi:DNA-protecting protein DprA [Candidatus Saccharibacteria bacterium]|nr:DNA-protecting protein DprA [Candidatus Saccharibacteria bacterium]